MSKPPNPLYLFSCVMEHFHHNRFLKQLLETDSKRFNFKSDRSMETMFYHCLLINTPAYWQFDCSGDCFTHWGVARNPIVPDFGTIGFLAAHRTGQSEHHSRGIHMALPRRVLIFGISLRFASLLLKKLFSSQRYSRIAHCDAVIMRNLFMVLKYPLLSRAGNFQTNFFPTPRSGIVRMKVVINVPVRNLKDDFFFNGRSIFSICDEPYDAIISHEGLHNIVVNFLRSYPNFPISIREFKEILKLAFMSVEAQKHMELLLFGLNLKLLSRDQILKMSAKEILDLLSYGNFLPRFIQFILGERKKLEEQQKKAEKQEIAMSIVNEVLNSIFYQMNPISPFVPQSLRVAAALPVVAALPDAAAAFSPSKDDEDCAMYD